MKLGDVQCLEWRKGQGENEAHLAPRLGLTGLGRWERVLPLCESLPDAARLPCDEREDGHWRAFQVFCDERGRVSHAYRIETTSAGKLTQDGGVDELGERLAAVLAEVPSRSKSVV